MPSGSRHKSSRHRHSSRSQTFPDPFFSHHQHHPYSSFHFTDPFTLFDSIFEDFNPFRGPSRQHQFPFSADPFERMNIFQSEIDALMEDIDRDPFGMSGFPRFGHFPPMPAFPPVDRSSYESGRGRWISESYMTSTVNGVTQTIRKRVDSDVSCRYLVLETFFSNLFCYFQGNEHITRTLPDGREIRTINGVEQSVAGQLPYNDSSKTRRLPEPSGNRYLPPIATHSQPMLNAPRDYDSPPPYTSHPTGYRTQSSTRRTCNKCIMSFLKSIVKVIVPDEHREHRRTRRSSEKCKFSFASFLERDRTNSFVC